MIIFKIHQIIVLNVGPPNSVKFRGATIYTLTCTIGCRRLYLGLHTVHLFYFLFFFQKHHSVFLGYWDPRSHLSVCFPVFIPIRSKSSQVPQRVSPFHSSRLTSFLWFPCNFCTKSAIESSDYVLKFPESCSLPSPISSEKSPKSRPIFGRLLWRHK